MADISSDISDLWWLKQDKPPSAVPALALGAQLAQHKMDAARQAEQFKTSTAMKLLDLGLEKDRNDLAYKSFQVKQSSDILRAQGMTEIGDFLSKATYNNKLTDPETQGNFWKLTSKYAPFINEQTVNSMWDNTFKAAMDRKDRADTHGRVPASAQIDQIAADLEGQADELFSAGFEAESKKIADRAQGLRIANRLVPPSSGPPEVGQFETPGGSKMDYYLENGKIKIVKPPKDNMSDLHRMQYAAELKALNYKFQNNAFDPSEKLNKKESNAETFNRLFKELSTKYESMATGHSTAPVYEKDPLGLFSK